MNAEENERLGAEALGLFTQILLDSAATAEVYERIDTRVAVNDYLNSLPFAPSAGLESRLRSLGEAMRDIFLSDPRAR